MSHFENMSKGLSVALDELDSNIALLHSRLIPVLRYDDINDESISLGPNSNNSPFDEVVSGAVRKVIKLNYDLKDILNRCVL